MQILLSLALATCIFASDDDRSSLASDDEYVYEPQRNRQDWATPELREEMNFWLRPESRQEIPYAMRGWDEVVYEIEGCPNTRLNGRYMPQYQPNTDPGMRMFGCWAHSQDMGKEDHESRKLMFWHAPLTCGKIGCEEDACDDWHTRPTWILADPTVMSSDVVDDRAAETAMYVAEGSDPQPGVLGEMEHSLQQPTAWNVTMGCANGWRRSPVAPMRARQLHIETARACQYLPTPLRSNVEEFAQVCSDQQLENILAQASSVPQLEDIQSYVQEFVRTCSAQQLEHLQSIQASNAQQLEQLVQEFVQPSSAQQASTEQLRRSNAQEFSSANSDQQRSDALNRYLLTIFIIIIYFC